MARPAPKPRKYEMMIVVAPTVTEDGLPAVVERVTGLIETHDGAIDSFNHDSPWGHRRLAYPIQNFRDAFYVLYYFDMAPRGIQELDRELRLDEAIIRHLIVKFDPLTVREIGPDGDQEDDEVAYAGGGDEDQVEEEFAAPAPAEDEGDEALDEEVAAEDESEEEDVAADADDEAEADEGEDEVAAGTGDEAEAGEDEDDDDAASAEPDEEPESDDDADDADEAADDGEEDEE